MSVVDDPMLALIIRFVTGQGEIDTSNEEFIKHQLETLQNHIASFPKEQQKQMAMEWIKNHAENYRRNWQKRVISEQAVNKRCADCPMLGYAQDTVCLVHGHWLKLLKEYLADEISSERYIEEALHLLREHKQELRLATRQLPAYLHLIFQD